jgi:hypothetical protein
MKKLIVALLLTAFACVSYAGDAKDTKSAKETKDTKEAASCCAAKTAQTKTASAETAKAKAGDCCGGCSKETSVKHALLSPKAAAERGL